MVFMIFCSRVLFLMFLLVWCMEEAKGDESKTFNVMEYGAVADGKTDNSQAFLKAWIEGCQWYNGKARVLIPNGSYMLNSVQFSGPCKAPIAFVIKGTLKAPNYLPNSNNGNWINFRYIDQLTVSGGGILDGQGHSAWPHNDCSKNSKCPIFPISLAFDFINDSRVHHLRSINSKNAHFNIYGCRNMNLSKIRLSAPDESPNTDGIKIGSSHRIKISRTVIATGDDCIAMLSGSTKIHISKVVCGPGHGISIGSLGRYDGEQDVSGIVVKNSTFIGTTNGVRIKTWSTPASCKASNFLFQDIIMENVLNPITIDQLYCPYGACDQPTPSNVQISDVTYKNIVGSSSSEVAVCLICSRSKPCNNVILDNINLEYVGKGDSKSSCVNVIGVSYRQQNPPTCL